MNESEVRLPVQPLQPHNDTGIEPGSPVTLGTIVHFLLGSRPAILALASRRDTFWLGLVLVISAGFARGYGRSDLWSRPWLITLPFSVTVAVALFLFPVVEAVARQRGAEGRCFWPHFRVFVSLMWMTAPLAWIFILPVERMMSADSAAIINLWFLGIVCAWRLILVTRILSVLFVPHANEIVFTGMVFVVILVFDTIFLCNFGGRRPFLMVASDANIPIADYFVLQFLSAMTIVGVVTWPAWLVGTLAVALWQGAPWRWTVPPAPSPLPVSRPVKLLAAVSVLIWAVLIPMTPMLQQVQESGDEDPVSRHASEQAGLERY